MNEMHKNYDYISKNNKKQEVIPFSEDLIIQKPIKVSQPQT
jgi:hypothetical protein